MSNNKGESFHIFILKAIHDSFKSIFPGAIPRPLLRNSLKNMLACAFSSSIQEGPPKATSSRDEWYGKCQEITRGLATNELRGIW